jgi:formylglycine-generating enzyme
VAAVFAADGEAPTVKWALRADMWMDQHEVSIARWAGFVAATGFVSEAEKYGWSFVHELAVPPATLAGITQSVAGSEWWLPVTNATWRQPEGPESNVTWRWDHPVVHVSQRDAAAFCSWAGGRLPSENEWEYAARGGKAGRLFPWGNVLLPGSPAGGEEEGGGAGGGRHRANIWQGKFPYNNTGDDGHLWAAPVDSFGPQNPWGLHHVSGNVWEWTSTLWCPQAVQLVAKGGGKEAPAGPSQEELARLVPTRKAPECARLPPAQRRKMEEDPGEIDYVKRGGSFLCHKDSCYRYRVAARHKNTANSSAYNLGFRCVYDAPPPGRPVAGSGKGA